MSAILPISMDGVCTLFSRPHEILVDLVLFRHRHIGEQRKMRLEALENIWRMITLNHKVCPDLVRVAVRRSKPQAVIGGHRLAIHPRDHLVM